MTSWPQLSVSSASTTGVWEFSGSAHATNEYWKEFVMIPFSSGSGTSADPYEISTTSDFNSISQNPRYMDYHYELTANLDFDGESFEPIGGDRVPFMGGLEGNDNTLSNITYDGSNEIFVGVIGRAAYAEGDITNFNVDTITISGEHYVSAVVGFLGL